MKYFWGVLIIINGFFVWLSIYHMDYIIAGRPPDHGYIIKKEVLKALDK